MSSATDVAKVTRALEQTRTVRLAVLFGSMAGGEASSRSDIDVDVSLDGGPDLLPALAVELERAAA